MSLFHTSFNCSTAQRSITALLVMLQVLPLTLVPGQAWAQAAVVPDRNVSGQRPIVGTAASGVSVVQILPPNAAGVSNNRFSQYNVGPNGLILNNSSGDSQTQIGGWISGNPLLSRGARTILNQVTGSTPTMLNGYSEVAGKRANVVVANPNGITCDGCGFINAARATMTTGIPQFGDDGALTGFAVQRGRVTVEGKGINARNIDQLDLIARSIRINAEVWANQLTVIGGAGNVDFISGSASNLAGKGGPPSVAIDVSELGGMYANSIRMVGTERGVGVHSVGTVSALTGDLEVDSAGEVRIAGGHWQAGGNMSVRSGQGIQNAGTIHARGNAAFTAGENLVNSGVITAAGTLQANAGRIDNTGTLAAGVNEQGQVVRAGDVSLAAVSGMSNTGQIAAGRDVTLTADEMTLTDGTITAGNRLTASTVAAIDNSGGKMRANAIALRAGGLLDNTGGEVEGDSLSVTAQRIDNTDGKLRQVGAAETIITVQQGLVNKGGIIASNGVNLTLSGATIDNSSGTIDHHGAGSLSVSATDTLNNKGGTITGNGDASLQAQVVQNAGGVVQTQGMLTVTGTDGIDNAGGTMASKQQLAISSDQAVDNRGGILQGDVLAIQAQSLDNAAGKIVQTGTGAQTVEVAGHFNNAAGTFASKGQDVTVRAGSIDNTNGRMQTEGLLTMRIDTSLTNSQGVLQAEQLDVQAGSIVNTGGTIRQLGTDASAITATGLIDNAGGTIAGNATNFKVVAGTLDNTGGKLTHSGTGSFDIESSGAITNNGGKILTNNALSITTKSLANGAAGGSPGRIQAGGAVTIAAAGNVDNTGGAIIAGTNIAMTAKGNVVNRSGVLRAPESLTVTAAMVDNSTGRIVSADGVPTVNAASLVNTGGVIAKCPCAAKDDAVVSGPLADEFPSIAVTIASAPPVMAVLLGSIQIPDSALFKTYTEPESAYPVQTDPHFTDYETWKSSDFRLKELEKDPARILKGLDDAFDKKNKVARQKMVDPGEGFSGVPAGSEAQYQALMQDGATRPEDAEDGVPVSEEIFGVKEGDLQADGTLSADRKVETGSKVAPVAGGQAAEGTNLMRALATAAAAVVAKNAYNVVRIAPTITGSASPDPSLGSDLASSAGDKSAKGLSTLDNQINAGNTGSTGISGNTVSGYPTDAMLPTDVPKDIADVQAIPPANINCGGKQYGYVPKISGRRNDRRGQRKPHGQVPHQARPDQRPLVRQQTAHQPVKAARLSGAAKPRPKRPLQRGQPLVLAPGC
jgi:filamentous hemagglutinin family protein